MFESLFTLLQNGGKNKTKPKTYFGLSIPRKIFVVYRSRWQERYIFIVYVLFIAKPIAPFSSNKVGGSSSVYIFVDMAEWGLYSLARGRNVRKLRTAGVWTSMIASVPIVVATSMKSLRAGPSCALWAEGAGRGGGASSGRSMRARTHK